MLLTMMKAKLHRATVTQADMESGKIDNTATSRGTAPGASSPTVSDPDSAQVKAAIPAPAPSPSATPSPLPTWQPLPGGGSGASAQTGGTAVGDASRFTRFAGPAALAGFGVVLMAAAMMMIVLGPGRRRRRRG